MKNLFTLFLVLVAASGFAQKQETRAVSSKRTVKHLPFVPNFHNPVANHKSGSASARTSGVCDTSDVLDYNTYAEIVAINAGLSYTGSLNGQGAQPYVQEASSSQITPYSANNNLYSYVVAAFDTLVFPNYDAFSNSNDLSSSVYRKTLKSSTVTLDSVEVVMAISGDTVSADGKMANDSLVFSIYKIVHGVVNTTRVSSVTYTGYAGLSPFFTDGQHITAVVVPVGFTFNQGEGFAVRADYYNYDTSSHCVFAYGNADSCTDLIYQGQDLGFSFAYPSPFLSTAQYLNDGGNSFWGEIDTVTVNNVLSANVRAITNAYGYFGISTFPENCAYVFNQNWQFLPFVTVSNTLGLTISGSNPLTLTCPSTVHVIATTKTGDLGGAQYSWSNNATTASISILNPGTYSVTVTNSSGCTATDQVVASYANNININPTFTVPAEICENQLATFTNTTTGASSYSANWNYGVGSLSSETTNPTTSYTTTGSFNVTLLLVDSSSMCKFNSTQTVTVLDCTGFKDIQFENNVSLIPNPSNGNVTLTVNGAENGVNINIYNVIGQTVKSFSSSDAATVFNKTLDLNNLTNGTYLVKIQSGNKTATKKLVITK